MDLAPARMAREDTAPASAAPALDLPAIQALAAADMAAVDALIRRRLASDVVLVNQVAEHIVSAGGKRLRPMLLLLAAGACGKGGGAGVGADAHQLAAVVEFIHTSTLLPDANSPPGCVYNPLSARRAERMMAGFLDERFGISDPD